MTEKAILIACIAVSVVALLWVVLKIVGSADSEGGSHGDD
jgi:hypothetical protein